MYREVDGAMVKCAQRLVLRYRGDMWSAIPLYVLETGRFVIEQVDYSLEQITEAFRSGKFTVSPSKEGVIEIRGLVWMQYLNAFSNAEDDGFLVELGDIVQQLQGKQGMIEKCRRLVDAYRNDPTEDNRNAAIKSYEVVPDYLRCWLGTFDAKDSDVRRLLGLENG
jgi:hypothetical protein